MGWWRAVLVCTRVCIPTAEEIRDRYQVREALDAQAARLYAERATPRQKCELETMAEHMDAKFNRMRVKHHHVFELYALDTKLDVKPSTDALETRANVIKAIQGHILTKAVYGGLFRRPQ